MGGILADPVEATTTSAGAAARAECGATSAGFWGQKNGGRKMEQRGLGEFCRVFREALGWAEETDEGLC
jgi:hypothetical protein